MRRPRFRIRTLLIAVGAVAVILAIGAGLQRRKERFERLFSHHIGLAGPRYTRSFDPGRPLFPTAEGRWHYELAMKYARAARYPWLPVEVDPPPP